MDKINRYAQACSEVIRATNPDINFEKEANLIIRPSADFKTETPDFDSTFLAKLLPSTRERLHNLWNEL